MLSARDRTVRDQHRKMVVAINTLELKEDNKFAFIWDDQLVLLWFDLASDSYRVLTDVEPLVKQEIVHLFNRVFIKEGIRNAINNNYALSPFAKGTPN